MNWNIDTAHSEVQFKVKHLVVSTLTGAFNAYEGTVDTSSDSDFDKAKVKFSLDTASISTNQADRDNHLKSADFFDVDTFPKLTFDGSLKNKSGNEFDLIGDITIKDVTKSITLSAELLGIMKDPWGNTKAGFEIKGKINRKDFGLVWNAVTETGGLLVSEDVKLEINIQVTKA